MKSELKGNAVLKHIRCKTGDVAPYVITPGDPARVKRIAEKMDKAEFIAENREYTVYTGEYKGVPLTVCSHGIGGPAASIAFEELIMLGAKVFIRVGSAGGRQKDIALGTPVVITASVRGEGTTLAYLPVEFPAAADIDVTNALIAALRDQNVPFRTGIGYSRDAYYEKDLHLDTLYTQAGVVAGEQEAAILYIIGSKRHVKTGAIVSVDSNMWFTEQPTTEEKEKAYREGEAKTIQAALDAVYKLNQSGAHKF
jgi:uridine phosphorylase